MYSVPTLDDMSRMLLSLTDEEIANPYSVLRETCGVFPPGEMREILDSMLRICLEVNGTIYDEPEERRRLLLFCELIRKSLEATYLVTPYISKIPTVLINRVPEQILP